MSTTEHNEKFAKPFAAFLTEQGRTHDELTETLHELIEQVTETGKAGSVTLTIKVEPDKKAEGVYRISDNVTTKIPQHDRPSRIYYKDKAGNLSRNDPNQEALAGLQVLESPAAPTVLKKAN
ncbi:hypothetical protein [Glutamicibacter arilaitensis]|uniref:hypothetical protein n=1 Tax=Glutamicibacter arilaitensis TaxID=256701 RepID=UPI00384B2E7E